MEIDLPLVSVIVPVYNGEVYMEQCIQMLQNQSYPRIELIVVDDGSTDRSVAIVEQHPEVKLVQQENLGVSTARNRGLSVATGDFVHFLDVDDMVNESFYQNMVQALLKSNTDMACSGMINQRVKKETHFFKQTKVYRNLQDKLKITYAGRIGYVWRYLFRSEFLRQNNLVFEEGRIVEDMMFSITALYFANGLVVVPEAVYTYIFRANSQLNIVGEAHQAKRDADWQHAKLQRKAFAEKHGFKVPGVDYGKLAYKWWGLKNLYLLNKNNCLD